MKQKFLVAPFFLLMFLLSCTKDIESDEEKLQQEDVQIQQYIEARGLNAKSTGSGVYIVADTIGKGISPTDNDYVLIDYYGWTLDDKLFDTSDSVEGRKNNIIPLNPAYGPLKISMRTNLPGWIETLKKMKEGGKSTAFMPAYKASISDHLPRRYEFTLRKVIPDIVQYEKQLIQEFLERLGKSVSDSTSGGYYVLSEKAGQGVSPVDGNSVYLQFKGALLNGIIFKQSNAGNDYRLILGKGNELPVLEDAIKAMKKGGTQTIMIPFFHGYGDQIKTNSIGQIVIPGYSSLLFEIQLKDVKD